MRSPVAKAFGSGVAEDGAGEVDGPGVGSAGGSTCWVAERSGRLEEPVTGVSGTSGVAAGGGAGTCLTYRNNMSRNNQGVFQVVSRPVMCLVISVCWRIEKFVST